jgi:hypothetical protein
MTEGAMCFYDCESLTPLSGTGEFDGQKAASHKSARAPRIVPRDLGGGREDGSWIVDSDDDDDDVLFCLCFVSLRGVLIEGNSSSGRIRERAPD